MSYNDFGIRWICMWKCLGDYDMIERVRGLMQRASGRMFWGYILTWGGISGYYGSYLKNHELFLMWMGILIAGLVILVLKDLYILKNYKSRSAFWDIPFLVLLVLFPNVPWPRGLSLLLTALVVAVYVICVTRYQERLMAENA